MNTTPSFKSTLKGLSAIQLQTMYNNLFEARLLMEKAIPDEAIEEGHWVSPELNAIQDIENLVLIELHSR